MTTHDDARAAWDAWISRPTRDEEYVESLREELRACKAEIARLRVGGPVRPNPCPGCEYCGVEAP